MKAVVLAADLGKRMKPLTNDLPKALVELGKKPLLGHVLESFKKAGVEEAFLVVGFGADKIMKKFGRNFNGMKLSYVEQKIAMGTALHRKAGSMGCRANQGKKARHSAHFTALQEQQGR